MFLLKNSTIDVFSAFMVYFNIKCSAFSISIKTEFINKTLPKYTVILMFSVQYESTEKNLLWLKL